MIFSLLALLALWLGWTIAYYAIQNEYLLPSFPETMIAAGKLLVDGAFWTAFCNTFLRTLWAFALSFVVGAGLALLADARKEVRAFLAPVISVLRTMPTMAVILVLLLWTSPAVAPVIVSLLVLMPAVYAAALAALDDVEARYGRLSLAYGVSAGRKLLLMKIPLSAPSLLKQSGAILSMGLKITISAEVLSNTYRSLGGLMQEAKMFVEMPRLLALTVLAVVLGFLLEGICALAVKLLVRWRA